MKLLVASQTLERSASSMDRLLTYGIVSSAGNWKLFNFMDGSGYTNSFVMMSLTEEIQIDAVRAKATIERSSVATSDDKKNATAHIAELKTLTSAAPQIADAVARAEFSKARQAYRTCCQTAFENAHRISLGEIKNHQERLGNTIIEIQREN